jgi:hypothetical protein
MRTRQGDPNERVVVEPHDRQGIRRPELDLVCEIDPLEHGRDLVLRVVAKRAHDEPEVDLGERLRRPHRRASASAANSLGSSSSART